MSDPFLGLEGAHFPRGKQPSALTFKMNAARQGSRRTTKCEDFGRRGASAH
jgi:hypothetical protein